MSRSESRAFSSEIIFMKRHTAASRAATNSFSGTSFARRWRMPVSVATTKRSRGDSLANRTIPSVERIFVRSFANAIAWLAQPHSG